LNQTVEPYIHLSTTHYTSVISLSSLNSSSLSMVLIIGIDLPLEDKNSHTISSLAKPYIPSKYTACGGLYQLSISSLLNSTSPNILYILTTFSTNKYRTVFKEFCHLSNPLKQHSITYPRELLQILPINILRELSKYYL